MKSSVRNQLKTSPESTSLDRHETSVDFYADATPEDVCTDRDDSFSPATASAELPFELPRRALASPQSFRHSGWAPIRKRVWQAMIDCCMPLARIRRFAQCGEFTWVVADKNDPRRVALIGSYCRDRFCTPCTTARSRYIASALTAASGQERVRMITLTIKTDDRPLGVHLDKLRDSFRKLRQTKLWQNSVSGGVAFMEVKYNFDSQRWHPHYHLLVVGKFIAARALAKSWLKATGDSYIVHITASRNPDATRLYATKYATKAIDNETLRSPKRLREAMTALRGKRSLLVFGSWKSISFKRERLNADWQHVVSLRQLLTHVVTGNQYAINVMHALLTSSRLAAYMPVPNAMKTSPREPPVDIPKVQLDSQHQLWSVKDRRAYDLCFVTDA